MKRFLIVLLLLPIVLLGFKYEEGASSTISYTIVDSLTANGWIDADSVDADHVTVNVGLVNSGYSDVDSLDADHIVFNENMVANGATIDANYYEASAATDGTRYFDFTVEDSTDPAGNAEVNAGYFAMNKRAGSNGTYTLNALEGVARSYYADEAGTFRGVYGRTYINAGATATMRTGIGGEFSARASYNGGTECVAENGTAFVGARIWMAPYFTDASISNINNFHGLWILNEAADKVVTNAIKIDATTYGSGFDYCLNTDAGKFYQKLDGNVAGSGLEATDASTGGDDIMYVRAEDYRTLTASQEYKALYARYNVRSTTPSNPVAEVTGIHGGVGCYVADEALTFRGGYFTTYVNADATSTMRTNIGCEISPRASYSGGTECVAENGTAFVGARIWMAPYFTSGSVGNINNFWGLWIYGEHSSQRNADAAIKISDAGGGFTDDIIMQGGASLRNTGDDTLKLIETNFQLSDGTNVINIDPNAKVFGAGSYSSKVSLPTGASTEMVTIAGEGTEDDWYIGEGIYMRATGVDGKVFGLSTLVEYTNESTGTDRLQGAQIMAGLGSIGSGGTEAVTLKTLGGDATAGMYALWLKTGANSNCTFASGSRYATLWIDDQVGGTHNGEAYGIFATTGGGRPDAFIGFETTSSGYDQLFYFDETFNSGAGICVTTDAVPATQDARIKVYYNGTQYYIPLYR